MEDSTLHVHHHHHASDKSHRRTLFLLIPSLVFALTLAFLYNYTSKNMSPNSDQLQVQSAEQEMRPVKVGETTVNAFIPSTRAEHAKGLGERDHLNENDGMLFQITQSINPTAFWMKGMRFPLDFIWIKNGFVTQIHANIPVPEPGTAESNLPLIVPNNKVDAVLEINAGFVKAHGIKIGDPVTY